MLLGAVDAEVGGGFAGAADFGAHTGVGRLQAAAGQVGPILAHGGFEMGAILRVDGVIDLIDPAETRAKAGLAGQIQGQMHTQVGALPRHWVDQVRKRRPARQAEISPLRIKRRRDVAGIDTERPGHLTSVQPRRVDDLADAHRTRHGPAQTHDPIACWLHLSPFDGGAQHQGGTVVFGLGEQGQHQGVAVENAGGGAEQGRLTAQRGLQGAGLGAIKPA